MRFRPGRPMRRPGPFRVGPPLFGQNHPLQAAALQTLNQANQFLTQGNPAAAAPLYAQLAAGATTIGRPRQAARLHLEAAQCWAMLGNGALALEQGRAALGVLQGVEIHDAMHKAFARLLAALRQHNLTAEADQLAAAWQSQFGTLPASVAAPAAPAAPPAATAPRGHLPAKCSSCGGAVRSDEVAWIDDQSAECVYCGSTLLLES